MTDIIERGQHAERLLNDPMLTDAFDQVAVGLHQAWESAPIRDREGQHELKLMLKLLNDVRANLAITLESGKLAAIDIKGQEKLTPAQFTNVWRKSDYGY